MPNTVFKVNHGKNIEEKVWNYGLKQSTTRKVKLLFFSNFLQILTKRSFWEEDWALGHQSVQSDIFLKFLNF